MLSDKKNDLQKREIVLGEFLREINSGKTSSLNFGSLVDILIPHCTLMTSLAHMHDID